MEVKNNTSSGVNGKNSNVFLDDFYSLHKHKGKYISEIFCVELEQLANKIAGTVKEQNYEGKIMPLNHSQPPEKISDKMVDLCLECIEIYLQKISYHVLYSDQTSQTDSSIANFDCLDSDCQEVLEFNSDLQILIHVICDLRALASYIRFTLFYANNCISKSLENSEVLN